MRRAFLVGLLAAAMVVGLAVATRHALLRAAIETGAGLVGYRVRIGALHVDRGFATLSSVSVDRDGQPLARVDSLSLQYSLRDLLPGSRHRFGIVALDVSGVKLTLTRFRDGSFNIALPGGPPAVTPQRSNPVPLRFRVRLRDAQIELREPSAFDESARSFTLNKIDADAQIDTAAVTRYSVTGAFKEKTEEPFNVRGRVDAVAGFAMHHAKAARFPLRALANYFAQTNDVRVLHGGARNFDALVYALGVAPEVAPSYHVALHLDIDGGRLALSSLALPIEGIAGRINVIDNDFFISGARASLAGIPLNIEGGVYDLNGALTGGAKLRLGVWGGGELSKLRGAFSFTRDQPLAGRVTFGVAVEGPVTDPLIVARARSESASYRRLPFQGIYADVIYHSNVVALVPLRATYGGIKIAVRGRMHTGAHLLSEFAMHVAGTADHLPYLDEMLGKEPMLVDASAVGKDLLFRVVASAASARGVDRVAALLQMSGNGTALVEPFWLRTTRGSLEGGYVLDRPRDTSAFWMIADGLRMHAPRTTAFPNLQLPQMPPIEGGVFSAAMAGGGSGNQIVLGGVVKARGTSISGVRFNTIDAAMAGTMAQAPINRLRATGPWGSFAGAGSFSPQRFVANGNYSGSFEQLAPFLGSAISGHGRLSGSVAIAVEPKRILVVGSNLAMAGDTLRGVPVDRASVTLAVEGDRLRIYSAHAHAAGGDVVVAGTFSLSPRAASSNALTLVANNLQNSQLHGIGLPLTGGTISASGALSAGSPLPAFDGGVAVTDSRIDRFALTGNALVRLGGNAVALSHTVGALGHTYAIVNGNIGSLTSGAPSYALSADVPAAQIAPALHAFGFPNYMTDGTFNARLAIGGRSVSPTVRGSVRVPAGDVNGLPFIDAGADLAADRSGVSMTHGSVLVGSTAAKFAAVSLPKEQSIAVDAPHADLSDFNNFFDTGDTLDGSGTLRFAATSEAARVTSSGNIDIRGLRYRNFPIGDTRAVWSSAFNQLRGSLAVGGSEGMLHARGSISLAPAEQWLDTLERSRFDVAGNIQDLDLSMWLPALGMHSVPITGRASGEATIVGRYPHINARGSARVVSGTIGPLTLDSAALALHSAGGKIVVDSSHLSTSELSATANGTLGLSAAAPIDLRVHAQTDHLAQLVYDVSRVRVPISGSFESTLSLGGTFRAPSVAAGFDATDVSAYGLPITSLFGEVRLVGRSLVLSNSGATFPKGEATLAGSLPLTLSPLRMTPGNQPLSVDIDLVGLDPSMFDQMLGSNSKLGGLIDGHIGLAGTIGKPQVVGRLSLVNGSYVSDLQRVPLSQMAVDLAFNHSSVSIARAFARAGSGTLTGTGSVQFPDGLFTRDLAFALKGSARGAQLGLPAYGSGTLDAALALVKHPGGAALLSGSVTLNNATLPFATFVKAATQAKSEAGAPIPLAFDVRATAGRSVRVRGSGYGAGLDIGATGSVHLAGTLAAPALDGAINSTGGTLTYFDRAFRVQEGSVRFNASDGVLPTLHAVATTNVVNPDPDRARNPYGSAQVKITVEGPIQGLRIGLESTPSGYTRDQILALIAPLGSFVGGVSFSRQGMLARQMPSGITPMGSLSPVPDVVLPQRSTITVSQEAFNILNAQFTAGLLAPLESSIGQGLGLSSINLTLGYYGNFGFTATRLLGNYVSAVYAATFGIPQVQSFGLVVRPAPDTTANLSFFVESGPTKLVQLPNSPVGYNAAYLLGQPLIGNTGFSLTLQRYFW